MAFRGDWRVSWAFTLAEALEMAGPGQRHFRTFWRPCGRCVQSGQSLLGRDRHQVLHGGGELRIERDERVGLELGQGDVLGVERVWPPELVGDLPCDVLKDACLTVRG